MGISDLLVGEPPCRRGFQFKLSSQSINFYQSVLMGNQQFIIISELNSPLSGGVESECLEGGEGVGDILVDEDLVAIVANGQIPMVIGDRERRHGDAIGLDCLILRVFLELSIKVVDS